MEATGFDAWQRAMQGAMAPLQSQINNRNNYQQSYGDLLNRIAMASAPVRTPGQQLSSNTFALTPNDTPNILGNFAQGGNKPLADGGFIDPGAFDFARSYLTGANNSAALPTGLDPSLQSDLDAFRTQYSGGAPKVMVGLGMGSRPLLARRMMAGMQDQLKQGQESWGQYQQDQAANANLQNQSYTDMMGGQFYGGVIPQQPNPNAMQPWTPPQMPMGGDAPTSPWGFAQQMQQPDPRKIAAQQNPMTFGSSPWGMG